MNVVLDFLASAWAVFVEMAPYLILGFVVAGVIRTFLPDDFVARRLGGGGSAPVLRAALLGIPLPLCSCGVIPAALGLRRQGASRGATLSFLVSTPETGVDSIAVTYGLLGPVMAVLRPIAALVNAIAAGWLSNALLPKETEAERPTETECAVCCGEKDGGHAHDHGPRERGRAALRFAFGDLLADVAPWLLLGLAIAAAIGTFAGPGEIGDLVSSEWAQMALMLAVSVPLYVCATASTPIAAALIFAGVSPGAALVLLLAGPATNAATILMVARFLGRGAAAVYLGSIAMTSLVVGFLVNRLHGVLAVVDPGKLHAEHGPVEQAVGVASAILLLALMARLVVVRLRSGSAVPPVGVADAAP